MLFCKNQRIPSEPPKRWRLVHLSLLGDLGSHAGQAKTEKAEVGVEEVRARIVWGRRWLVEVATSPLSSCDVARL